MATKGWLSGGCLFQRTSLHITHDRGGDDNQVNTRGAQQYTVNLFVARMDRKIPSQPGHHASKSLFHLFTLKNQQRSVDKTLEALKLFIGNVEEKLQQKTDDREKKAIKLSNKKR